MTDVSYSRRAQRDLLSIFKQGLFRFGPKQAERYGLRLQEAVALLAAQPHMGRPAKAIRADIRRHEHGAHIILYRETPTGILVLAVVHGRSLRQLRL